MGELLIWAIFGLIVGVIAKFDHAGQRSGRHHRDDADRRRRVHRGRLPRAGHGPLRARTVRRVLHVDHRGARAAVSVSTVHSHARVTDRVEPSSSAPTCRGCATAATSAPTRGRRSGGLAQPWRVRARSTSGCTCCGARRRGAALVRALRWPRRPDGRARRNARRARRLRPPRFRIRPRVRRAAPGFE